MPLNGVSDYMPSGQVPARVMVDLKKEAGKGAAIDDAVNQFLDDVEKGSIPKVKLFFSGIGRAEELRGVITIYRMTQGIPHANRMKLVAAILSVQGRGSAKLLEELGRPSSKGLMLFSKFAAKANGAALLVTAVEVSYHLSRGDIGPAAAEAFKFGASKLWPWAAVIEAVQSLVDGYCQDRHISNAFLSTIRILDPVGVGAAGMDGLATLAVAIIGEMRGSGGVAYSQLERLQQRYSSGPTAMLADLGYKIGYMSADDWKKAAKAVVAKAANPNQRVPMGMIP